MTDEMETPYADEPDSAPDDITDNTADSAADGDIDAVDAAVASETTVDETGDVPVERTAKRTARKGKPVIEPLVIGIDGGGTTTRVALADASGRVLASVTGDGSAVRPSDPSYSAERIAELVEQVRSNAGQIDALPPAVLLAGLAGGGQDAAARAVERELSRFSLATRCVVVSDAEIALEDAFSGGPGILLIAGTGSSAFARTPAGQLERCGGWGPTIGDEGSGAWLGRKALSVVTAASDGREPETSLIGAILTFTEQDSVEGLIPWASTATPAMLATLAPTVLATAAMGDLRANAIVSMAIEELIVHVRALARRSFVDERAAIEVALAGGLLTRGSLMRKRLEQRMKSAIPGAAVLSREVDAVKGAIRAARRAAGVELD
jgi:glucosamine kinase